jgi:hypothetical protein
MDTRTLVRCATSAALLLAASAASAQAPKKSRLWLEARPFTCSEHLSSFARELTLACDAAGGQCAVAADEATADRRLILHCTDPQWWLEGADRSGAPGWTVELVGSDADRLRSAAVFAVRAESAEAPRRADLAPAPSADPREPMKAVPARSSEPPSKAAPAASTSDPDRVAAPSTSSLFSVALAPRGGMAVGNASTSALAGVGAFLVMNIVKDIRLGVSGAVDYAVREPGLSGYTGSEWMRHSESNRTHWSGGAVIGIGAPFDRTPAGLFVEGGYGVATYTFRPCDYSSPTSHVDCGAGPQLRDTDTFGTVRGAVVYQLLSSSSFRPWAAASLRHVWDPHRDDTNNLVGLDLGVVWDP